MAISNTLLQGIEALKKGNPEGFNTIYAETSGYVFSKCRMIMKDEQDAYDLTQETFVMAYQNIESLKEPQSIYGWLGAIAYRQGMKIYRKKNDVLLDEEAQGMFEAIEDENIDWRPEMLVEHQEVGNIIAGIIDELPPLQKLALTSFYYDGLKIDEIAQMCDCSSNTIKSRLNYAKKFVKERVEEKEKQSGVKLHSAGGLTFLISLGAASMLGQDKYILSSQAFGQILSGISKSLGIQFTGISGATAANATVTATAGNVAGAGMAKAGGMATSKLIGIIAAATIGALAVGATAGYFLANANKPAPAPIASETELDTSTEVASETEVVSATETENVTETEAVSYEAYIGTYYEKDFDYESFIKASNTPRVAVTMDFQENVATINVCALYANGAGQVDKVYLENLVGTVSEDGIIDTSDCQIILNEDGTITYSGENPPFFLSDRILIRKGDLQYGFPGKDEKLIEEKEEASEKKEEKKEDEDPFVDTPEFN